MGSLGRPIKNPDGLKKLVEDVLNNGSDVTPEKVVAAGYPIGYTSVLRQLVFSILQLMFREEYARLPMEEQNEFNGRAMKVLTRLER